LLRKIGEGGCGIVFHARQEQPLRREVALKIIKAGMDTAEMLARFEVERQALALLDHPNIAKVFDAGATEGGRPYHVMELVRGRRITEFCAANRLNIGGRLELFLKVCSGMRHAHMKGIIHRDLKPSNILVVDGADGNPDVPRIIDFGIAKSTGPNLSSNTDITAFQQYLGTPAYMSPEQAGLGRVEIDARTDVYSLGALLYELLTGCQPFQELDFSRCAPDEILRLIREKEPQKPSARIASLSVSMRFELAQSLGLDPDKLRDTLSRELDWVVMKCLEKDRARRYESVSALADDLERYLNHEPVLARPAGVVYRFQKLVRRNRLAFAAAGAVTFAVSAGIVVSLFQSNRADRAETSAGSLRVQAQNSESQAWLLSQLTTEQAAFLHNIMRAADSGSHGEDVRVVMKALDGYGATINSQWHAQPKVQFEMWLILADCYHRLEQFSKMQQAGSNALGVASQLPGGATNFLSARALDILGDAYRHLKRTQDAEDAGRSALAIKKNLTGVADRELAVSMTQLGFLFQETGRYAESENMLTNAVSLFRESDWRKDENALTAMSNLSMTRWKLGKTDLAEDGFRELLAAQKNFYGPQHPEIVRTLCNLSGLLLARNAAAEAESCSREAATMARKFLGNKHPLLGTALANLGRSLSRQGRFKEAEEFDRESLQIFMKTYPLGHPLVARGFGDVGADLRSEGRETEAQAFFQLATNLPAVKNPNWHKHASGPELQPDLPVYRPSE
jgi:tetratricopeptide (TPR) repeat protein